MKILKILALSVAISLNIALISFAGQWVEGDGTWKYENDDGSYIANDWYQGNDGNSYFLGSDGVLLVGWFQVGNDWYYAKENGALIKNSWITYNGDSYYLQADGKMSVDTVVDGYKVGSDGKKVIESIKYEVNKQTSVVSPNSRSGGIPAGEYVFYASPDVAHVKIINGSECIVDKYNFIELHEGDLTEVNGLYVPVENVSELDINSPGMFRVGIDIAEGTYDIVPPEDTGRVNIAICTVFNSIPSSKDMEKPENNIVSQKYVYKKKGTISVEVKNGQYLQLLNCTANLRRP